MSVANSVRLGQDDLSKKRQSVLDVGQRNQLESVQAEVRHNTEVLTTLRRENKELHTVLQQSIRGQRNINVDEHYQKEEELLHNKLCVLKRSLNAVKGRNAEFSKEIERTVQNNLFTLKEGDNTMDEGSSVAQKIRTLENRLDKCLMKHNEVEAIRKTYEVLLERLQLEQAGFDLQLNALEKTLASDDKELSELAAVGMEAATGRDNAKAELAKLKQRLVEERRQQRKDLEQRRSFVQEKREYLEKKHNSLLIKMAQQEERHERLLNGDRNAKPKKKPQNNNPVFNQDELEKLQSQKEKYHRLRDATLCQNVGEVIHKLLERRDNNRHLKKVLAELEEAIASRTREKTRLQQQWDEVNQKAGGAMVAPRLTRATRDQSKKVKEEDSDEEDNGREFEDHRLLADKKRENAAIVIEFERHLHDRQDELLDAQREQDTLSRTLLDVEAGVQHLAEKLSVAGETVAAAGAASVDAMAPAAAAVNASNTNLGGEEAQASATEGSATVELLRSCEAKIQLMMEELTTDEIEAANKELKEANVPIPASNVRLPHLMSGLNSGPGAAVDGDEEEDEQEKTVQTTGGKQHRPQIVDEFPDNEVHDRQELKMMSLAAVEREVKKARQMQQRHKDEAH